MVQYSNTSLLSLCCLLAVVVQRVLRKSTGKKARAVWYRGCCLLFVLVCVKSSLEFVSRVSQARLIIRFLVSLVEFTRKQDCHVTNVPVFIPYGVIFINYLLFRTGTRTGYSNFSGEQVGKTSLHHGMKTSQISNPRVAMPVASRATR